jgi:hypothetical protein
VNRPGARRSFCRESWDNWDMMGLMKQIGMIPHERIVPEGR